MVRTIIIVLGIILGGVGTGIGYLAIKKPIKIEFKVSILNCIAQAIMIFTTITLAIFLELAFNQYQLITLQDTTGWKKLLSELLDAGLLVAIIIPLISAVFGRWIERYDLDLCSVYSETVLKAYFSLVAVTNCIWYLYMLLGESISDDSTYVNVFSRIIIWGLNIVGTWMGIGFHCKGRIARELENIKKSQATIDWKTTVKYILPFAGTYIFLFLLLWGEVIWTENFNRIVWSIYSIWIIAFIIVFTIGLLYIMITIPTKRRSDRILSRAIRNTHTNKHVNGKYSRIRYSLLTKDDKKYLLIHSRNIVWAGHEDEIHDMFSAKEITVADFDYKECKALLTETTENQRKFIQDGFEKCKKATQDSLVSKNE